MVPYWYPAPAPAALNLQPQTPLSQVQQEWTEWGGYDHRVHAGRHHRGSSCMNGWESLSSGRQHPRQHLEEDDFLGPGSHLSLIPSSETADRPLEEENSSYLQQERSLGSHPSPLLR